MHTSRGDLDAMAGFHVVGIVTAGAERGMSLASLLRHAVNAALIGAKDLLVHFCRVGRRWSPPGPWGYSWEPWQSAQTGARWSPPTAAWHECCRVLHRLVEMAAFACFRRGKGQFADAAVGGMG